MNETTESPVMPVVFPLDGEWVVAHEGELSAVQCTGEGIMGGYAHTGGYLGPSGCPYLWAHRFNEWRWEKRRYRLFDYWQD